jgi:flagellar motor switch protein FliN/FliY
MSDGALSQDEIDALLAGVDSTGFGSPAASASSSLPDGDRKAMQDFLGTTVQAQSSNLSMMTGAQVSIEAPQVDSVNRESFLQRIPDMVTAVKADITSGFPGEHLYMMADDTAKRLASLMNKEDNIELDDMALSVIGEVASQLLGTTITSLSDRTGNKNIASEPPQATNVPKAVVALPSGDFLRATYQLDLGDGTTVPIWEVFGASFAREAAKALGGGKEEAMDLGALGAGSFGGSPSLGASGGMGQMGLGGGMGGMQGAPAMGYGGGGMASMGGGAMGGMPGMGGMGGFGMGGGAPTNVQSIQFPSLVPQSAQAEQGNIGLIMDVFMEMTVELGRTKKLIKEILGMGEGTIIELDKLAGEPVDILVNHKLIAKGEVVVIDENFGVRVTEIVSPMERMSDMG